MRSLIRCLLITASAIALNTKPLPTFAQVDATINDTSDKIEYGASDANHDLWLERIGGLVDYVVKHGTQPYKLEDKEIEESNLDELVISYLAIATSDIYGDAEKVKSRIIELGNEQGDQRTLKIIEILSYTIDVRKSNYDKIISKLNRHMQDPDWLVVLTAKCVARASNIIINPTEVSNEVDTVSYIIPGKSADGHEMGEHILAKYQATEMEFNLESERTYQNILKLILIAQEKSSVAPIVVHLQNLIDMLQHIDFVEYETQELRQLSEKLVKLDFGTPMQAQVIIMHNNTFSLKMDTDERRKHLTKAVQADPKGRMGELAKVRLVSLGIQIDDKDLVAQYAKNSVFEYYENGAAKVSPTFIEYERYTGKITNGQAITKIRSLNIKNNIAIRQGSRTSKLRPLTNDLMFADGKSQLVKKYNEETSLPATMFNQLNESHIEILNSSLQRLSGVNRVANETKYDGAKLLEYLNTASKPNSREFKTSQISSEYFNLDFNDIQTIRSARLNPVYRTSMLNGYGKGQIKLKDESLNQTEISKAYIKLIEMNLELRVGRIDSTWQRLKDLTRAENLTQNEKENLQLDILITEINLLFIEGNTTALISHIEEITKEAVRLNRRLNTEQIMIMLALSLEDNGYTEQSGPVIDSLLQLNGPNQIDSFAPIYLRARHLISTNDIDRAQIVISNGIKLSKNKEDEALLLGLMLNLYTSIEDVPNMVQTRIKLLDKIEVVNSNQLFESFAKDLTFSSYIIDKSQGVETTETYTAYMNSLAKWNKSKASRQANLSVRRVSAERDALNRATTELNTALANESSRELGMRLLLLITLILSILSGLLFFKSKAHSKLSMIREERTEKTQALYDRMIKDDYFQSKRAMDRIKQQIEKLLPRLTDVRDEQLLELIISDVEDQSEVLTKNTFIRRATHNNMKPISTQLSLVEFAKTLKHYWERQASGEDLKIKVKYQSNMPYVFIDEHYLKMITMELIQRSLEHTIFGLIEVDIQYTHQNQTLQISVLDTGHGTQVENIDYHLTKQALEALSGSITIFKPNGFVSGVKIQCPAKRIQNSAIQNVVIPTNTRMTNTNDR